MRVGFTGTQIGMTDIQKAKVTWILQALANLSDDPLEFHHGDCIGADEEAHAIARTIKNHYHENTIIIGHPPILQTKRAFCDCDEWREPKEYLDRNHNIVREVEVMIATPKQFDQQWRGSGTWATIRYSRKLDRYLYIVYPDGSIG